MPRRKSGAPNSSSSAATARLVVEWLMYSFFAARVKLPSRATARKMRSCSSSVPHHSYLLASGSKIHKVNGDEIGESRFREKSRSDDGIFSQEYFVYFKKK